MNNYNNYTEARESRKCWFINCGCKGKLPAVGVNRSNGKEGKKDSSSRRFHTSCNNKYNERIYNNMYCQKIDFDTPEGSKKYNELHLKYELESIKPEFRPFLNDFKQRKACAIRMNKKK